MLRRCVVANAAILPSRLLLLVKQLSRWFEPQTSIQQKKPPHRGWLFIIGRSDWTRTSDLYVPNVAFYQAELHFEYASRINITLIFNIQAFYKI